MMVGGIDKGITGNGVLERSTPRVGKVYIPLISSTISFNSISFSFFTLNKQQTKQLTNDNDNV